MSSPASNSSIQSCLMCSEFAGDVGIRKSIDSGILPAAEVVHQECPVCDAFDVDKSQLCHLCAHIRPAHLLTCSIVHDILEEDDSFEIVLGTLEELEARQGHCAFCRWCLHVVQADSRMCHYSIDDEEHITLIRPPLMESFKHDTDSIHDSETYGGISNLLVRPKTSRFSSGDKLRYISIGHNKRLPWAFGSGLAINLSLPKFRHFASQSLIVEWDIVRRWKAVCEQYHSICCKQGPYKQLPFNFRLIDVESKSIVEGIVQPISFFALSYVWGANSGKPKALLRKNNLAKLKQIGGLHHLPRTIAHAMEVCKTLNQRYLWVDRLCIVQDDEEDKFGQIQSMGAIYSCAELVIVAACGDSMQYGLHGVHNELPREQYQISTDVFGFTMANMFHKFDAATKGFWDERGWTYQEAVLARRKLYFTEAELWFECSGSLERENVFSSRLDDTNSWGNHLRQRGIIEAASPVDDFDQYTQHLKRYSRRILTYPSDIYNAFRGIQNSFYDQSDVLFGLPESDFSRALLWYPTKLPGLQERHCDDRDMTLPSWSWASLMGAVETCEIYGNNNNKRFRTAGSFYCSLCRWATRTVDETPQRYRIINSINDQMVWPQLDDIWSTCNSRESPGFQFVGEPDYRQLLALAWTKGCIEAAVPVDLIDQKTVSSTSPQSLAYRWPTVQHFWDEVHNSISHKENFYDVPCLGTGHLVTRTQCAALCIGDKYQEKVIFKTNANGGEHIGVLLSRDEYRLRGAGSSDRAAHVDFIALAVGCMPWDVAIDMDETVLEQNCFHVDQPELRPGFGQPGVIVMAVKWQGAVARRVALGWVALQGWVDSEPEFRTVILS